MTCNPNPGKRGYKLTILFQVLKGHRTKKLCNHFLKPSQHECHYNIEQGKLDLLVMEMAINISSGTITTAVANTAVVHIITFISAAACGMERRISKVANSSKTFGHISGTKASTALDEVLPLTFSGIKV